jgi:hypothetical protein
LAGREKTILWHFLASSLPSSSSPLLEMSAASEMPQSSQFESVQQSAQAELDEQLTVPIVETLDLRKANRDDRRDNRMIDAKGNTILTSKYLRQLCKEQGGYQTAALNDKFFLHFKGLEYIRGLEEYTGLKSVWFEGNGIQRISGLQNQTLLRCLYDLLPCII